MAGRAQGVLVNAINAYQNGVPLMEGVIGNSLLKDARYASDLLDDTKSVPIFYPGASASQLLRDGLRPAYNFSIQDGVVGFWNYEPRSYSTPQ